jgi:hypothetical protein
VVVNNRSGLAKLNNCCAATISWPICESGWRVGEDVIEPVDALNRLAPLAGFSSARFGRMAG